MSRITLTLDEEVEAIVHEMAIAENIAPDLWLSQFVKQQVKQHQGWSPEVKALAGSWTNFSSLDEIRRNDNNDVMRESLSAMF